MANSDFRKDQLFHPIGPLVSKVKMVKMAKCDKVGPASLSKVKSE